MLKLLLTAAAVTALSAGAAFAQDPPVQEPQAPPAATMPAPPTVTANTPAGAAPASYPPCRHRHQDRCEVMSQVRHHR
jgi:hypothetical protein